MKFNNYLERPIILEQYYLMEGLTHIEHFEDNIINKGIEGLKQNINIIKTIINQLPVSDKKKSVVISTKFDGSPSLVFGTDEMGFFVSTKSAFNKNPKLAYNDRDVDELYGPSGLKEKLKAALQYLPKLDVKGIYQGDILFTDSDKKSVTIDGEKGISFTPNTITYVVPDDDSNLSKEIKKAHFGIVVHTEYTKGLSGGPSFNVNISKFKKSPDVWVRDPFFKDESGIVSFDINEYQEINDKLEFIEQISKKIDPSALDQMKQLGLDQIFKQFENDLVRRGIAAKSTKQINKLFIMFLENLIQKEVDKLTKPEAKEKKLSVLDKYKQFIYKFVDDLTHIFNINLLFTQIKSIIVNKLKSIKIFGSFIKSGDTYKVTSPEGFCVIDSDGSILKLVDRMEFSRLNFLMSKNR